MRTTERFLIRKKELHEIFSIPNLVNVWRKIVWQQLRKNLDIFDMYDYYDFSFNIEENCKHIRRQVLSGHYKAKSPLIFKLEKKYGISRHIMLPTPSDALILQTLVESLSESLLQSAPTKKAYFSRDKHALKFPHEIQTSPYENWQTLWKRFQKEILNFTETCEYLAVTDLTNYYDNIGLRELRHIISARVNNIPEVVLDLLFNIIEQLSWVPDYLPLSLKGLPTINLEAPRLLAHSLLFETDEVLNAKTKGNFVRWMDDINFGVNSIEDACEAFGVVNDVLKSRGLALNIGKTKIYSSDKAKEHFLFEQNKYLDSVPEIDATDAKYEDVIKSFYKNFEDHLTDKKPKNWDKVTKRYFTKASKLKTDLFLGNLLELFQEHPNLRPNIANYLSSLGFSEKNAKILLELLHKTRRFDNVTLFYLVRILTDWNIPRDRNGRHYVKKISEYLKTDADKVFDYYCFLWFSAKYAHPKDLLNMILTNRHWHEEPFLARQVVALLPRIIPYKPETAHHLLEEQIAKGLDDASSVALSLKNLMSFKNLPGRMFPYLFNAKASGTYKLPKFLILYCVLNSEHIRKQKPIQKNVKTFITDDWYKHWIEEYLY